MKPMQLLPLCIHFSLQMPSFFKNLPLKFQLYHHISHGVSCLVLVWTYLHTLHVNSCVNNYYNFLVLFQILDEVLFTRTSLPFKSCANTSKSDDNNKELLTPEGNKIKVSVNTLNEIVVLV